MLNLSDILQSAQGGQAIQNLAAQFGLSPSQAQQAVSSLLPALSAGLKSQASDADGLGGVLDHLTDPQHQAAFQSPAAAQSDESQMAGQQALNQIVGGDSAIAAIAQRAAAATGVSPELLQQMLPQVTSIAIGGLSTAMQNHGLGGVVDHLSQMQSSGELGALFNQFTGQGAQTAQGGGGLGGMLGGLVGSFLGGRTQQADGAASSAPSSGAAQAGLGALTQLFDHGTGNSDLEQDFAQLIGKN
jgi:hypothetical protein